MDPFQTKVLDKAFDIATELERRDFMFENSMKEAASLADMDAHNARVMHRGYRSRKREFASIWRRNVYACFLGLDIQRNFYKNIYSYKKPLYKIRKGENLLARLTNTNQGSDFQ